MEQPNGPGGVTITFEFRRHMGPRFIQAGVTLEFDDSQPFSFSSTAEWPENHNYEDAIREEVERVLQERLGSLEHVRVVLKAVSFDRIDSSPHSFRRAARIATELAFDSRAEPALAADARKNARG